MDVENIIYNFIDDDSTKNSTQDHLPLSLHHHEDITSIFQNKKNKKSHESLNDFYSNKDNDGDNKTYQEKIWELTDKRKVNSTATGFIIHAKPNSAYICPYG